MVRHILFAMTVVFLFLSVTIPVYGTTLTEGLPLKKGTSWTYSGSVKWQQNDGTIRTKSVTWKSSVTEVYQKGHITFAVLSGFPFDLAWYEDNKQPGSYLIIRVGSGKYYLIQDERVVTVLQKALSGKDLPIDTLNEGDLLFDLPLVPGKVYGETGQLLRDDKFYIWFVESAGRTKLSDVSGVSPEKTFLQFTVNHKTLPDSTSIVFIPAIGIVRYTYRHNGTISEADLRLIKFHTEK